MKRQILAAALLALSVTAYAQTEKKQALTPQTELAYNLAPDGKTKDGVVTVKNKKDKLLVQGRYTNNERSGTWYFFNDKEALGLRYSYDQKKVLFLDPKTLENVKVQVLSEDPEVAKNASTPLPLCPVDLYVAMIGTKVATSYYDQANDGLTAEITAHIGADGKASYTVCYLNGDKKSRPVEIAFNPDLEIDWVPSSYQGKKLPSEFSVYAKIDPHGPEDTYRRFNWSK